MQYALQNPEICISNKLKIFETCANSILLYAAEVWGFLDYDQVEKLYRFFIKKVLCLPMNTPNYAIYLETNTCNQNTKSLSRHFNYVLKVLALPSSRLPKLLAEETISRNVSWAKELSDLRQKLGFAGSIPSVQHSLALELSDVVRAVQFSKWRDHVQDAKSSTFHDMYPHLSYESLGYFCDQVPNHAISLIFKARTGMLNINARAFKTGTDGICSLCNLDEVENTFHFISICPVFKKTRLQCFGHEQLSNEQFLDVMNCKNILGLYIYLSNALKYRSLLINEFQ